MRFIKYCLIATFIIAATNAFAEQKDTPKTPQQTPQQSEVQEKVLSDDEVMQQLILSIESFELKIKTQFEDLSTLQGDERSILGMQFLGGNKDIAKKIEAAVNQLLKIKEQGGNVEKYTVTLHRHLNRRNKQLKKTYKFMQLRLSELNKKSSSIELSERFVFEQKVNNARGIIFNILLSLQGVIDFKETLNIDNNHDVRVFSDLLRSISTELSSRLKLTSAKIKNKKNEISNSSKEGKGDLEIELNALNERSRGVTEGLSLLITLMQKHELDTTRLSQLLITSSGTINQQIFDKEVIVGLLGQWQDEFEKWLMLNASSFVVSVVIIILILILFRLISVLTGRVFCRALDSSKVKISKLLRDFFVVSVRRFVMFIGVLIALSQAGVELGPLLAGLGMLGFVVGFALQGVLSNFASGLMILIYRPYDVGDVVEIAKVKGTVKEMSMVSTTMLSFNNERLVIPNNNIWGSLIRNITSESTRRVDLVFKISFDADIEQLEKIFTEEVRRVPAVLVNPAPTIELNKQYETHLEFIVRPWVKTSDYWATYWALNKAIQIRMNKEGVPKLIPYAFLKPLIDKV